MASVFKKITSIVTASFVLLSMTAAVYAEAESDPFALSVTYESFETVEETTEDNDSDFYEWMEEAAKKKEEEYNRFKLSRASYPTAVNLNVSWEQQINSYYCGPATAVMILRDMGYDYKNYTTQTVLAGSDYLKTTTDGTPWYSGTTQTDSYYFNMPYGLNKFQNDFHSSFIPRNLYLVCNSNDTDEYIDKMMYTLSQGYAVPLLGQALNPKFLSEYLQEYTQSAHWLVLEGYMSSGSNFMVVDPASGIKGFEDVPSKYGVAKSDIIKFIQHGVIW